MEHVPELLSYLQQVVDDAPQKGRFIITGSQNFALSESISQTLSGRVGMTTLLPLTFGELGVTRLSDDDIFKGGYPWLYAASMLPTEFFPSYIQTYIERDVRQIRTIENLGKFQSFLKVCAGRVGQLVNMASLAQDCGISPTTAKQWLSILEASYVIFFLQPFYKNFTKRFSKMPKLYFYDTGLACSLLGLEKAVQLQAHYFKGALYKNAILLELFKSRSKAVATRRFLQIFIFGEIKQVKKWML